MQRPTDERTATTHKTAAVLGQNGNTLHEPLLMGEMVGRGHLVSQESSVAADSATSTLKADGETHEYGQGAEQGADTVAGTGPDDPPRDTTRT